MTTNIDDICVDSGPDEDHLGAGEDLAGVILDMSRADDIRLYALEQKYVENGEETIEIVNRLIGMYQMSGVKNLGRFLQYICNSDVLGVFLKLETVKGLINHAEFEEDEKDMLENVAILNKICGNLDGIPTPIRVEAVVLLMNYKEYQRETEEYVYELILDKKIECEYRYMTILGFEQKSMDFMKKELIGIFDSEKEFVDELLVEFEDLIRREFPDFKPNNKNRKFFDILLNRMNYDQYKYYWNKYPNPTHNVTNFYEHFLFKAQIKFLYDGDMVYYRVLSAQYLLQKFSLSGDVVLNIETTLLDFAQDEYLDYDRRADAADVLLRMGSAAMKEHARIVIMNLGYGDEGRGTLYRNAQNVHIEEVELSVMEVLEYFSDMRTKEINGTPITFEYVREQIQKMLEEETRVEGDAGEKHKEKHKKINVALSRIDMDRALYSKYNNSLNNILVKVWTYLDGNENEGEMRKRLLEELEEMSGTCSTGFASRLINVISGFGDFNIRISWEDQIVANFFGRLNAKARLLQDPNNIFRTEKQKEVVELYLNAPERQELREELSSKIQGGMEELIEEYLREGREEKLEECYESFSFGILSEMTISSSRVQERKNFSLFFRTWVAGIREEMYGEFKEHMDDASFDLYMRKALMQYEGL